MLKAVKPQALTEEECKAVFHAMAVLIETNHVLQQHAHLVATKADQTSRDIVGLVRSLRGISQIAHFRAYDDAEEAGA